MKTQCSENKTNKKYLKEWNDWGSTGGGDLVWGNSQDIMYLKDFKNPQYLDIEGACTYLFNW